MLKSPLTAFAGALMLASLWPHPACAQGFAFIEGTVVDDRANTIVGGASVALDGEGLHRSTRTDASGHFRFPSLEVGEYRLTATSSTRLGILSVELSHDGATVTIRLFHRIADVQSASTAIRGSGTDLVLTQGSLQRMPSQGSLSEALLQTPGAARGANGVVHVNGDHGDINYLVDGMPIPQELNRQVGSELDPADVSYLDVMEGAYPAQYGERFGLMVNVNTRAGQGPPGADGYVRGGSYATVDSGVGEHVPVGNGSLSLALRGERSDHFLDPPQFAAVHDAGSATNQFLRLVLPRGNDVLNFTAIHSYQAFQIPNAVSAGQPAATDDNETQDDTFATVQYHHTLAGGGTLSYGIGGKRSRIRDFPDQGNDFAYGENVNLANGGSPNDCANGVVSACAYSLYSDRIARDLLVSIDDYVPSARHSVRAGVFYDLTGVQKVYKVTLQPGNFLAPLFSAATPGAPYTVVDDAPTLGRLGAAYVQDTWRMGPAWTLDYGLRYDNFSISSTEFARDFAEFCPRIKLTLSGSPGSNAYVYYGRYFEPFSLENVSPTAAQLLNLPRQPAIAQFDLRPEKDTVIEAGGHVPLGRGQIGLRVMQKTAVDLIDDTQVGLTALHQDINYANGNVSTQSLYYQRPLANAGRSYLSITHTRSVNRGCETQLLAPCFGAPQDWTAADHDQNWDLNGGVLLNGRRGGWFAIDGEYGSGLSSAYCQPPSALCKVPPHTTFDLSKGVGLNANSVLTFRIRDIFNDRYWITYQNAQGNHYNAGRIFEIGWALKP